MSEAAEQPGTCCGCPLWVGQWERMRRVECDIFSQGLTFLDSGLWHEIWEVLLAEEGSITLQVVPNNSGQGSEGLGAVSEQRL